MPVRQSFRHCRRAKLWYPVPVKSICSGNHIAVWTACALALSAKSLRADQLQMQNGDRYVGKVLSVTPDSVVLQSDVLGKVTLPRNKVSLLTFDNGTNTNAAAAAPAVAAAPDNSPSAATTNADLAAALRNLGGNTNFIQQVRQQMLTGSPQAGAKYDELVSGLMTGQLNLADIRKEAKSSIDQINELKRDLGPEAGDALDSYLSILQNFVDETAPAQKPAKPPVVPPANAPTTAPSGSQPTFRDPAVRNPD